LATKTARNILASHKELWQLHEAGTTVRNMHALPNSCVLKRRCRQWLQEACLRKYEEAVEQQHAAREKAIVKLKHTSQIMESALFWGLV